MYTTQEASDSPSPRRRRTRRTTGLATAAGVLGGGAIGLMFAVPSFTNAAGSDAGATAPSAATVTVQDTGSEPVPLDDPAAEPGTRLRDVLQPLVDDGTITADQADKVSDHLVANRPQGGPGGEMGERHGRGPGRFDGQIVADLLGVDAATLRTEVMNGSTLAEVATAQGVDPQAVIDGLVAEAKTHLDQGVADGRLSQDEADARLTEMTTRITDAVNNGGGFGPGGMGPRGGHGPDDDGDDAPPISDDPGA